MRPSDASTSTSWSARRASACSANQRNPLAHLAASPLAWANGFPVSVVTTWAMSGSSPSNSSAAVISKRDRSANVLVAQSDAAAAADWATSTFAERSRLLITAAELFEGELPDIAHVVTCLLY